MTMLMLARPRQGTVGERQRVAHQFAVQLGESTQDTLVALCGGRFRPADLERLDQVSGMPCEPCLSRTPLPEQPVLLDPAVAIDEGEPVSIPNGFTTAGFDADRDPARYRYEVVAEHLAGLIESGQLASNTRLPAEGLLAQAYGVSLGTARHATRLLSERGLVVTVKSKGTYVASAS